MDSPAAQVVAPDSFVTISYQLFDQAGALVEGTSEGGNVHFVHGYGQVLPGLEAGLLGAKAGDKLTITLEPENGFGEFDEEGVFGVERSSCPENVAVGDELLAEAPDGDVLLMRVLEVDGDEVKVDTNHPLAGQRVRFEVEVEGVREATEEEIQEAESELDDEHDGCCDHDHEPGHDHSHDHSHGQAAGAEPLVALGKKPHAH